MVVYKNTVNLEIICHLKSISTIPKTFLYCEEVIYKNGEKFHGT